MPMQRELYPPTWSTIALRLKEAAAWTCEECGAKRGELQPNRYHELKPVVITVSHVNHDPWNSDAELRVLCASCHIRYDARDARRKRAMMAIARGQLVLPGFQVLSATPRTQARRPNRRATRRAQKNWPGSTRANF